MADDYIAASHHRYDPRDVFSAIVTGTIPEDDGQRFSRHTAGSLYLIQWHDADIIKIGVSGNPKRRFVNFLGEFTPTVIHFEDSGGALRAEKDALAIADGIWPKAFSGAGEARAFLRRGLGWSECFRVGSLAGYLAQAVFREAAWMNGGVME